MKRTLVLFTLLLAPILFAGESFTVETSGHGRPILLIPGLSSPGSVWNGTVAHLSNRYECHTLTLAGFAGTKPVDEPLLAAARRDIVAYIQAKKLDRPILIGHSLGGFLAFAIASSEPKLIGGVISVDGLPAAGALMMEGVPAETIAQQAEGLAKMIASQTAEQFAMQTKFSLSVMITKKEDLERVAAEAVKSDPATVGNAMRDLLTTDLRPQMKNITVPVLLIAAGSDANAGSGIAAKYESQIAAIPRHEVVVAKGARHFVMLDDPKFFLETVDSYLARDAKTSAERSAR